MTSEERHAVIDIGSNSVRLVVYNGPPRAPVILFNEKLMAGLGRGVVETGRLDEKAMASTLRALERFRHLAALMGVAAPTTVATAATRQAENGEAFLERIAELGLDVSLLSGDAEAEAAALGVISGFENPSGIVGDLGGGSLELARIEDGAVLERDSFPLGVMRVAAIRGDGRAQLTKAVRKLLKPGKWAALGAGRPFYLVGGSWRSLAKVHMHLARYPLPILHHYTMPAAAAPALLRAVKRIDPAVLKARGIVAGGRAPALVDAAALLSVLVSLMRPSGLIVSATGLREGLQFQRLPAIERGKDPLIVAAHAEGARQGRFPEHGELIERWIAPLFRDEHDGDGRLRIAACLLGDIAWSANPDFRAELGLEVALHGNWLGLDARGRAMIGQALYTAFGGGEPRPSILAALAAEFDLDRAQQWGLAIRLGQRLSGGCAQPLEQSSLSVVEGKLRLTLSSQARPLLGDAVERRLKNLAQALGVAAEVSHS